MLRLERSATSGKELLSCGLDMVIFSCFLEEWRRQYSTGKYVLLKEEKRKNIGEMYYIKHTPFNSLFQAQLAFAIILHMLIWLPSTDKWLSFFVSPNLSQVKYCQHLGMKIMLDEILTQNSNKQEMASPLTAILLNGSSK